MWGPHPLLHEVSEKVWENIAVAIIGPVAVYAGTLVKSAIEQSSAHTRQSNLCEEADRLIKFHSTLSAATIPSASVQNAQTAVACQLNRVLEKLSVSLTEPPGSGKHARSTAIVMLENWLLLYRPVGFFSWLLHLLFYLLVPLWFLITYVVATDTSTQGGYLSKGDRVAIAIVLAMPLLLCNYLARKMDGWVRRRRAAKQVAAWQSGNHTTKYFAPG